MVVAGVACDSQTIVVDNEPEVAGRALDAWAYAKNVTLRFIRPGKPKVRTRKMIRELRTLGYRVELLEAPSSNPA
jgi:hypothetical protein